MTNGLSVNDITPLGERPADVWRGRTGVLGAGVFTMGGSPFDGLPTAAGDFYVYDPTTDEWVIVNTSSFLAGLFLTTTEGEQHQVYTNTACGATQTIDLSVANWFDLTLTANCTITITNPPASGTGGIVEIILRQGGSGSYTVTWPAGVKWQAADGTNAGSAPTLHTAVGAQDDVTLTTLDGGATYGASHGGGSGSPLTTKGDLWGYSSADARLPVGADGYVPTADSGAALGISYQNPALVVGPSDHARVAGEVHLSDGSTTTFTLDEAFMTGSVEAWNTTTLAWLTVTEVVPDQATVSAAGTTGDSIVFNYDAVVV